MINLIDICFFFLIGGHFDLSLSLHTTHTHMHNICTHTHTCTTIVHTHMHNSLSLSLSMFYLQVPLSSSICPKSLHALMLRLWLILACVPLFNLNNSSSLYFQQKPSPSPIFYFYFVFCCSHKIHVEGISLVAFCSQGLSFMMVN